MIKVKNKKAILKLAKSSFTANRLRNIFAVIAIMLTSVLFTGLFTVASSLLSSMEESTMRQVGGRYHGGFKYLTKEQYDKLKTHESIKSISYSVVLGIAENKELANRPSEIRYSYDKINANNVFSMPTTGRMPQNDDEIAVDTIVLDRLGIPAELSQKITLEYSLGGKKHSDTFTLVGFWQGDKLMRASQVWLSRSYVEKQLENYIPADKYDFIGKLNADVHFANSFQIENKLLKVIYDSGYTTDEIAYGVNWAYTGNSGSADIGTILGAATAILMIVFCGYLIISNVFYISVAKDIRFYGLLKAIGTTGRQIRFLIRRQALLLCIVGVPLGLLAGYFVGALLTPIILSILNTNIIKITLSPIAFLASSLFAVFTVLISVARPSKLAASVSPIEALRSTDGAQPSKTERKKSGGISLRNMAHSNVLRNIKKTLLVTISLSLSLVILNSAYSLANSFDMDKYLSGKIGSDFAIGDVSCFNVHINYSNQDTLSQDFLNGLAARDGIDEMSHIYFTETDVNTNQLITEIPKKAEKLLDLSGNWLTHLKESAINSKQSGHIYGLDDAIFKRLTVFEGSIDAKKLKTGSYVVVSAYGDNELIKYYEIGDKVKLANADGTSKEYEVLAVAEIPYNISIQHRHPINPDFFLPSEVFLNNIAEKAPMLTTLNVSDSHEAAMESYLADYCQNTDQNMQYNSKATLAAEYENTQSTYKSVGTVLSLLVAFIGVMNFINTIVTSIISRKREIAMLQSIGMTNKQTQILLVYEGLVYTVFTVVLTLTLGSLLGYLGTSAFTSGSMYSSLHFTVLPSLLCLPILIIISISVPYISERIISKSSVVERLREAE